MLEGDCVLQPPGIRHRVLEASDGMEVIEVACPAEHETVHDHTAELPEIKSDLQSVAGGTVIGQRPLGGPACNAVDITLLVRPEFSQQIFVWHHAASASWQPGWARAGPACDKWERRDLCVKLATQGLAELLVVRSRTGKSNAQDFVDVDESTQLFACNSAVEFHLLFVLHGN